ncbi:MAG: hypothetical protein J6S14_11435 [Clostridia bacterium]|nr:hypothetical protein [Clostridia bacterium]
MKKISCILLAFVFVMTLFVAPINAETINEKQSFESTVIEYEDGSYLTIFVPEFTMVNSMRSTATTILAEQPARFTNSSGEIEWEYTLTATFSYVYGSSATCTNASYDYTIYENSWEFSNGSSSRSGATAYGYGTFKNKFLFVTTKTINVDLSMTCDIYGNVS